MKPAQTILAWFLALSLLLTAGCSGLATPARTPSSTPPAETRLAATSTATQRAASATTTPASGPKPAPGHILLRVWAPPQFDPQAEGPAGEILRAQIQQFQEQNPGVRVEVRIKEVDGPGGMLDTLASASAAAPLALPDLVALPRPALETAALKGLLYPYDSLSQVMDEPDWYEYARQLARLQNSTFGLPFAGDALLLVYRSAATTEPLGTWEQVLATGTPLVFPAADPQALATLALYQASGGEVLDNQGRPFLDPETLARVLSFYLQGEQAGVLPYWLTQYATDQQTWEVFQDGRANLMVTWASRYLGNLPAESSAAPLPTADGAPFTLASGWVWALANPQPERRPQAAALAEALVESGFLARWNAAAGYLPLRTSALDAWTDPALKALAQPIVTSARLLPSSDVLVSLGAPLSGAVAEVLKEQSDPAAAAQKAAASLNAAP